MGGLILDLRKMPTVGAVRARIDAGEDPADVRLEGWVRLQELREVDQYGAGGWRGHRLRVACGIAQFRVRHGQDFDYAVEELVVRLAPLRRRQAAA